MNINQAIDKVTPILRPKWTDGVCSFGWLGDNTHRAHHQAACHAYLSHSLPDEQFYYNTITTTTPQNFEEVYDWTEWLLSDTGPWKNLMKNRSRAIIVEEGRVLGWILETFPTDDAHLLKHVSIASRMPQEFLRYFGAYNKLVAEGVERPDAFYLSHQVSLGATSDSLVKGNLYSCGHNTINRPKIFSLRRFIEGDPHVSGVKLGVAETMRDSINRKSIGGGSNARFENPGAKEVGLVTDGLNAEKIKTRWADVPGSINTKTFLDKWYGTTKKELLANG